MTDPVIVVDDHAPIVYGRPRYLAPLLVIAVAGAVAGAIIAYLTYGRIDSASHADVLGNRAVTQKLTQLVRKYEAENHAHRERNEEAHACLIWLDVRILHDLGDRGVAVKLADPAPCDDYTLPGAVPPLPTTTTTGTTRPRPTTTGPRTRRSTAPTTTTTRPVASTHPTTTTTTCTVPRVQGVCAK